LLTLKNTGVDTRQGRKHTDDASHAGQGCGEILLIQEQIALHLEQVKQRTTAGKQQIAWMNL
jgi:hypothetical protein